LMRMGAAFHAPLCTRLAVITKKGGSHNGFSATLISYHRVSDRRI
jgi:hypothetical protein